MKGTFNSEDREGATYKLEVLYQIYILTDSNMQSREGKYGCRAAGSKGREITRHWFSQMQFMKLHREEL